MTSDFPEVLYLSTTGKDLLRGVIGQKIIRMFHYYCGNKDEFQEYLCNLPDNLSHNQCFSLIEGPLLVEFDSGIEISFFAEEGMLSIGFSLERDNNGKYMEMGKYYTPQDLDDNPSIDVCDTEYSNNEMRSFLNKIIDDIKLFRYTTMFYPTNYPLRDSVIQFTFENGTQLALGYNIHSSSTPMSVIPWNTISREIQNDLTEVIL